MTLYLSDIEGDLKKKKTPTHIYMCQYSIYYCIWTTYIAMRIKV